MRTIPILAIALLASGCGATAELVEERIKDRLRENLPTIRTALYRELERAGEKGLEKIGAAADRGLATAEARLGARHEEQRRRLDDALGRLERGEPVSWAELLAVLGGIIASGAGLKGIGWLRRRRDPLTT